MTYSGRPVESTVLVALAIALAHRGPDGHGYYMAGSVGLVQTRLAITDLLTGNQPFLEVNRGVALVANGEIYNYRTLRTSLGSSVTFTSSSDCELPLYLYCHYGLSFVSYLRGMYALAIYDPGMPGRCERLILARDPFGIKPLYYVETSTEFIFASEPRTLVIIGAAQPHLEHKKAAELIQLQFTTGTSGLLAGIQRVAPGETLVIERGQVVERYYRLALPSFTRPSVIKNPLAELGTMMYEAVSLHQQADVPYGLFLSGGVDSSALLAIMACLNEQPILAFTAWFPNTNAQDELIHTRAVAAAVKAESIDVPFTEDDFWALLPASVAAMDDPAADWAIVPTYKLASVACKSVRVILSGEGSDELFGGYGRYRTAIRPWPFTKLMRRKGLLDGLGLLRQALVGWRDGITASEQEATYCHGTRLQQVQAVDCANWLPNDLLGKLDRCLMVHGIEGRVPFLDSILARFAYSLPDDLKIRHGIGKWLLRSWLANTLPEAKPFTAKRGFTVPVGTWLAHHGQTLGTLVAHTPAVVRLCRPEAVKALFINANQNRHTRLAAWILLFHALWVRCHIDGVQSTNRDVYTMLEE